MNEWVIELNKSMDQLDFEFECEFEFEWVMIDPSEWLSDGWTSEGESELVMNEWIIKLYTHKMPCDKWMIIFFEL